MVALTMVVIECPKGTAGFCTVSRCIKYELGFDA